MKNILILFTLLITFKAQTQDHLKKDSYFNIQKKIFITNQILDLTSTLYVFEKYSNRVEEANPFMKSIVEKPIIAISIKALSSALALYFLDRLHFYNPLLAKIEVTAINFLMSAVVLNNIGIIIKLNREAI